VGASSASMPRRWVTAALCAVALAVVLVGAVARADDDDPVAGVAPAGSRPAASASSRGGRTLDLLVRRSELLGRSVLGRPIRAFELGDPDSPTRILVVGCIHGNECAGLAVARSLEAHARPASLDLWIVPDLNPDGFAAGTRQNARGVDLNRNFPYRWRPIGGPGDLHYSGTTSLSEPESRIAYELILRLRPRISIWFHQALGLVDESGGSVSVERRFATLVGLPIRRLRRYPGSATTWENERFPGTTAFVVELRAGQLPPGVAGRYAGAVLALRS